MAGYDRYSMSNNAREAYSNGEKPLSKWNKALLIHEIIASFFENDFECDIDDIQMKVWKAF